MSQQFLGYFSGVGIYAKPLPSGDIAVWHRPSNVARAIVEPLCTGHGYWDGQHNNWVVFQRFASSVVHAITERCRE